MNRAGNNFFLKIDFYRALFAGLQGMVTIAVFITFLFEPTVTWPKDSPSENAAPEKFCKEMNGNKDCTKPNCIKNKKNICIPQYRFLPYQPNSAVWQYNENDKHALEVNFSFRYLLTAPDCTGKHKDLCNHYDTRWENFLTYTGKFDFYLGTRPSSPVVNRLNNPAIHLRKYRGDNAYNIKWIDIGIEHKSNGQTVSANELVPGTGQYRAAVEYQAGNNAYIDSISRSTNYLSIETKLDLKLGKSSNNHLFFKLYAYHWNEEYEVHWGEFADQNVKFSDFERLRTIINIQLNKANKYENRRELGVEWTVGDMGLATDSANVWIRWPWDLPLPFNGSVHLPMTIRAHFGPMNELSNYSESQRSLGIGLSFYH